MPAQSTVTQRVPEAKGEAPRNSLSLVYQGILTAGARIRRSGRVEEPEALRAQMCAAQNAAEEEARQIGYEQSLVRDAGAAAIYFLDESVLNSPDPNRRRWSAIHADWSGGAVGGDEFFRTADHLLRQAESPHLADALEVFLLCLLLGYQGKHGGAEGELLRYRTRIRARIEQIRGVDDWSLPHRSGKKPASEIVRHSGWLGGSTFRMIAILAAAAALIWVVFRVQLESQANALGNSLAAR